MRTICVRLCGWLAVSLLAAAPALAGDSRVAAAARAKDRAAVRGLLKARVNPSGPEPDGATALHWAANWEDLEMAGLLVAAGANANAANDYGVTPLSLAAAHGQAPMVGLLLKAGADPNLALPSGETPLMTASRAGRADAVTLLLDKGARIGDRDKTKGQTALMWAVADSHLEVARLLVGRGADVKARSATGFSPILFAARQGNLEMVQALLAAGADINDADDTGATVLLVATVRGHAQLAMFLLDTGANPNAEKAGFTPLHWAAAKVELSEFPTIYGKWQEWGVLGGVVDGRLDLVRSLLAHGADPNAKLSRPTPRFSNEGGGYRNLGATPLFMAASNGETDTMQVLVKGGADPKARAKDGATVLIAAVGRPSGDAQDPIPQPKALAGVTLVLSFGVDPNAADEAGDTALHTAAFLGYEQVIKYLAEHGANVNQKNKRGETPLRVAMGVERGALKFPGYPVAADMLRRLGGTPE